MIRFSKAIEDYEGIIPWFKPNYLFYRGPSTKYQFDIMPPAWNKSPKLSEESRKEIKVERKFSKCKGTHLELRLKHENQWCEKEIFTFATNCIEFNFRRKKFALKLIFILLMHE